MKSTKGQRRRRLNKQRKRRVRKIVLVTDETRERLAQELNELRDEIERKFSGSVA